MPWKWTGYEELSLGHVKFEMPITHLRRVMEYSFRCMRLDSRGIVQAEDISGHQYN